MTEELKRRQKLFSRPALWVVIFMSALVLFIYPFLGPSPTWNCRWVFFFLFSAWGLIIILMVFIGTSIPRPGSGGSSSRSDY